MSRSHSPLLPVLAELLMVLPGLALALTWVAIVVAGVLHAWDLKMHEVEIGRAMVLVLIGGIAPTILGVVLFILSPRPRGD